jgi:hypothetical protein
MTLRVVSTNTSITIIELHVGRIKKISGFSPGATVYIRKRDFQDRLTLITNFDDWTNLELISKYELEKRNK